MNDSKSSQGLPIATPININSNTFIIGLYKAWKICNKMDKEGKSKSQIGLAFYYAISEFFRKK